MTKRGVIGRARSVRNRSGPDHMLGPRTQPHRWGPSTDNEVPARTRGRETTEWRCQDSELDHARPQWPLRDDRIVVAWMAGVPDAW